MLCRATDLTTVDLLRGELVHDALRGQVAIPTCVRADLDRRLVVPDERRRVWMIGPEREPRPIHDAAAVIVGLELHDKRVYVLTQDGRLTVLG